MDVCVVGHITKDLIRIPGKPDREMAGGSAYYVSVALHSLGLEVEVITKVAESDRGLLAELETLGIRVLNGSTQTTTVFENVYTDELLTARKQFVRSVADPIAIADLDGAEARAFHIGPLTRSEISIETIAAIRQRAPTLALDAQGMLREIHGGSVHLGPWPEMKRALAMIDVLKVDDVEAEQLIGLAEPDRAARKLAELGTREVLVTFADRGSLVLAGDRLDRIPAIAPAAHVDATGCGDTYAAGYLFARLRGDSPEDSARFAAAAASLKLEGYGPFTGTPEHVHAHLLGRGKVS